MCYITTNSSAGGSEPHIPLQHQCYSNNGQQKMIGLLNSSGYTSGKGNNSIYNRCNFGVILLKQDPFRGSKRKSKGEENILQSVSSWMTMLSLENEKGNTNNHSSRGSSSEGADLLKRNTKETKSTRALKYNGEATGPKNIAEGDAREELLGSTGEDASDPEKGDQKEQRFSIIEDDSEGKHGYACPEFVLAQSEENRICKPWIRKSLIVKLLGRGIGFKAMEARLEQMWPKLINLIDLGNEFYLVRFSNSQDMEKALTGGPWLIHNQYLTVRQWCPNFDAANTQLESVAVWVRFPNIPMECYDEDLLRCMGNQIGKTLKIDQPTSTQTRGKYARLSVVVDISKPLLVRYKLKGKQYRIRYERLRHLLCFNCGCFGHYAEVCPQSHKNPSRRPEMENEGYQLLQGEVSFGTRMPVAQNARPDERKESTGEESSGLVKKEHSRPFCKRPQLMRLEAAPTSGPTRQVARASMREPRCVAQRNGRVQGVDSNEAQVAVERDSHTGMESRVGMAATSGRSPKDKQYRGKQPMRVKAAPANGPVPTKQVVTMRMRRPKCAAVSVANNQRNDHVRGVNSHEAQVVVENQVARAATPGSSPKNRDGGQVEIDTQPTGTGPFLYMVVYLNPSQPPDPNVLRPSQNRIAERNAAPYFTTLSIAFLAEP